MNESTIQIGLPCADPQLCFWVGVAFGLLVLALIIAFIFTAWREHRREGKARHSSKKRTKL